MGFNAHIDSKVDFFKIFTPSLDVASVAANTTAEQTFTVLGLETGDIPVVAKPALDAGLGVAGARVSAKDTLAITFVNSTAGAINPGAETYTVLIARPENP